MASKAGIAAKKVKLLRQVRCPHCWHRFPPHECLFIAGHESLRGDAVVGEGEFFRFRPSRFTATGHAIDPGGVECRDIACPRCHLGIPRSLLEFPTVSISIVGSPASGKSYYLAAMTSRLAEILPQLGWTLADADPEANTILHESEQLLFRSDDPGRGVRLDKTDVSGARLYHEVTIDNQTVSLPFPFQFTLTPRGEGGLRGHVLVLYDNAGESFLPGHESVRAPVTEHLTHSDVVFFMLDPTQDPRFRERIGLAEKTALVDYQQELILNEAIVRIRKALGLSAGAKHKALLIVVLAKADMWESTLPSQTDNQEPITADQAGQRRFDFRAIGKASARCRTHLQSVAPALVAQAESAFYKVFYVPVSATGSEAQEFQYDGQYEGRAFDGYRPRDLDPKWTLAPIACALGYVEPSLAPARPARRSTLDTETQGEAS